MRNSEDGLQQQLRVPMPRALGGRLCLDFVNTVDPRADEQRHEFLNSYSDLIAWARQAQALTEREARELLQEGARRGQEASAVLARAIELREAAHRVFYAAAHGAEGRRDDLARIEEEYREALSHAALVAGEGIYAWEWTRGEQPSRLDRVIWPVARSVVDLLTSSELARVKECHNHGCGWLFLDLSKNRSRRWCSMSGCGSEVKMRRQYARRRAARHRSEG